MAPSEETVCDMGLTDGQRRNEDCPPLVTAQAVRWHYGQSLQRCDDLTNVAMWPQQPRFIHQAGRSTGLKWEVLTEHQTEKALLPQKAPRCQEHLRELQGLTEGFLSGTWSVGHWYTKLRSGSQDEMLGNCLDKLKCLEEGEDLEVIPEDTDLVTLRARKRFLEHREETITIDRACRQETFAYEMCKGSLRTQNTYLLIPSFLAQPACSAPTEELYVSRGEALKVPPSYVGEESHAMGKKPENPADMVEEGELILSVNILYPIIFHKHKEHKPYQTVLVLGSQKLTELRDAICCVSDLQIGGEFSSTPDQAPEHVSKDLYKSAFFYFEGTFYNDKRYPECRDLSRTIVEWSEAHDRGYGKFQTARMEDFTFNDLNIKLGFPYLYCHQGDCEHVVVITDIRSSVQLVRKCHTQQALSECGEEQVPVRPRPHVVTFAIRGLNYEQALQIKQCKQERLTAKKPNVTQ
ncbi:snRNA-activating protein complex subunit 3 [Fukomys damarensis]|uniref:snRNA-activating protein complex subunit 3 n=1 Tax=Fukomys damarensis TaxID=885580 RepID=A0A091E5S1_FUKDA|nr:snRNA-activating protein complex subunit 3 [Fukomys damarensis]